MNIGTATPATKSNSNTPRASGVRPRRRAESDNSAWKTPSSLGSVAVEAFDFSDEVEFMFLLGNEEKEGRPGPASPDLPETGDSRY